MTKNSPARGMAGQKLQQDGQSLKWLLLELKTTWH